MRTTLLLASLGILAAAEQPKPKPELSTAARIALSAIVGESKKLADQQKDLASQYEAVKSEECQRVFGSQKCDINGAGQLVLIPAPPPEARK